MKFLIKCSFLFLCFAVVLLIPTASVHADNYGLSDTAGRAGLTRYGGSVPALAGSVIGTALSLISVVFFILMVYGGFLWMTDHGKEEQAKKAKDTIIAAVIGIIIVLASYAITSFVFDSVSNKTQAPAATSTPAVAP